MLKRILSVGLTSFALMLAAQTALAAKGVIKQPRGGGMAGIIIVTNGGSGGGADPAPIAGGESIFPGAELPITNDVAFDEGWYVEGNITRAGFEITGVLDSDPTIITSPVSGNVSIGTNEAYLVKSTGSISGNVTVNGGVLVVLGGSAKGNITIGANSSIVCKNNATVSGGSFRVTGGGVDTVVAIIGGTVNGVFSTNGITMAYLANNQINGNVTSHGDENVTVTGNTISGGLEILNTTRTCISADNTVGGTVDTPGCLAYPQTFLPVTLHPDDGDVSLQIIPQSIHVHFNPKEYAIEEQTPWQHQSTLGADAPEMEFTSGDPSKLQVELFFDRYEEGKSVRESVEKIEALALVNPELHRPPTIPFTWGSLEFKGVLDTFQTRYTLFLDDGTPVRAVMSVIFKEFSLTEAQVETVVAEVERNAEPGAGEDPTAPPRIYAVLPTSAPSFMPIAIGGTNFGQGAIPFINNTPSISLFGFSTQNLPLIGSISVGVTIVPPSPPPGGGAVQVEWFGQRSNPFPFTVQ